MIGKRQTLQVAINKKFQHIGIIYSDEDLEDRFSHLGWRLQLNNESSSNAEHYHKVSPKIHPIRAQSVRALLRNIHETNGNGIEYGFSFPGQHFENDGSLRNPDDTYIAFTCATYVLSVFESAGLAIAQTSTWPKRDDKKWFEDRTEDLATGRFGEAPSDDFLSWLRSLPKDIRFLPIEVFSAAALALPAATFGDAEKKAKEIADGRLP